MASANLFQQFLQPARSVQDYANDLDLADARRTDLQTRQQQNALSALSLAQARRQADDAEGDRNALQRISSTLTAETTPAQRAAALRNSGRAGLMIQADALEKAEIERQKGAATAAKDTAEADKIKLASDYMRRDRHLQALASVTTPQQAAAWIDQAAALGEASPEQLQQVKEGVLSGQIPLEAWKQRAQQGGMSLQQQAQARLDELQRAETQRHNKATEGLTARGQDITASTTRRGQDMTDSRARDKNQIDREAIGKVEWKQDADGNWVALPKEVKSGQPVTPVTTTAPGKREVQANHALDVIGEARTLIDGATGSYAGNAVDEAARVVGKSTAGARATAKLKAMEGALMMAQPRMEGPQSDKDVALYRQMAGQIGDPTVPNETKKAALDAIEQLHRKYTKGGRGAAPASGGGARPSVSNW